MTGKGILLLALFLLTVGQLAVALLGALVILLGAEKGTFEFLKLRVSLTDVAAELGVTTLKRLEFFAALAVLVTEFLVSVLEAVDFSTKFVNAGTDTA